MITPKSARSIWSVPGAREPVWVERKKHSSVHIIVLFKISTRELSLVAGLGRKDEPSR